MMNQPYVPSEDINSSSISGPRAWLTSAQREHSENFIGSDKNRVMADAIRDRELLGSDGIVRERPAVSLSYSQALEMLGMTE
jgi:hypothetical protein